MKANEAPEKIYIQSFNVSKEDANFDKSKLFFDDIWTEEPEPEQENIEYTRTDAFIEKACKWLKDNITYIHPRKGTKECIVNLTKFKDYMKVE